MLFSYKEPAFFRDYRSKRTRNSCKVHHADEESDSPINEDEFILYCDPYLIDQWEDMMLIGASPIDSIRVQYNNHVPIFTPNFLRCLPPFFRIMPKEGAELFNFILDGPISNIEALNWVELFPLLISNLPCTIYELSHALFIQETKTMHHISLFLQMGGLSSLYPYGRNPEYQLCLSCALTSLSAYKLSACSKSANCRTLSIVLSNDNPLDFSKRSSYEEEFENDSETQLCQFFEHLLTSSDKDVRIYVLMSLLSLAEHDEKSRDFISNLLLTYIQKLATDEERIYALKILSISLNTPFFPYIENIYDISSSFMRTTDGKLIDAVCAFIEKIMDKDCEEYILNLGIVQKITDIVVADAPFAVKQNALIVFLRITNTCSPNVLFQFVSPEVLMIFFQYLELDNEKLVIGILKVILRICRIQNEIDGRRNNFFNAIEEEMEKLEQLTMAENQEIAKDACLIMEFMKSE